MLPGSESATYIFMFANEPKQSRNHVTGLVQFKMDISSLQMAHEGQQLIYFKIVFNSCHSLKCLKDLV